MNRSELLKIIDHAWLSCGCNRYLPLSMQSKSVRNFYSHQCWITNAAFSELDPTSTVHREAIQSYICQNNFLSILDYGGGSKASLLKLVRKGCEYDISLSLYEPFIDQSILPELSASSIKLYKSIDELPLFCLIICKDVLEHVDNPLKTTLDLKKKLAKNGIILMGNSFDNTIKCRLPKHFHLKYTFWLYMSLMGFRRLGAIKNCRGTIAYLNRGPNLPFIAILAFLSLLIIQGFLIYFLASLRRILLFNAR